ncbi:MAG: VWA domain-containing protein [Quisquiliibacterium sp.]
MNQALALLDAQRLLTLFAQGISGRYLHLKPTEALGGSFRPQSVTTDGAAIFLPEQVDLFQTRRQNLGFYRIAVLHQVGLIEAGTYDFTLEQARGRIANLPGEDPRLGDAGAGLARFFGLWPQPRLMRLLFMICEDLRIDRRIARLYPGARADLSRAMAHALATRPALASLSRRSARLEALLQYTLGAGRDSLCEAMRTLDPHGPVPSLLDALAVLELEAADVYDSAAASVGCYRVLTGLKAGDGDADASDPDLGQLESSAPDAPPGNGQDGQDAPSDDDALDYPDIEFRGEVMPELVQRQMRAAQIEAQLANAGIGSIEPQQLMDLHERQMRRQLEADRVALYRAFGHLDAGSRSFLIDEWDFHGQRYLRGWCRLFERRLRGEDFDFIDRVRERHGPLARRIKRQFMSMRPESYHRERPVLDGEQLEIDALIEQVVRRRTGQPPDDRVYMRRERGQREVACALLLDMSASTDYPVPEPGATDQSKAPDGPVGASTSAKAQDHSPPAQEDDPYLWAVQRSPDDLASEQPEPRRVIDVARESLALMCQALDTLGDSHAVYGFSGYGREEVEFYVAKEFNERLSARSWAAIAQMKPRRSTRMGPAIRHASAKLRAHEARTRLLIVISDGFPEDHDYGPDRNDHEYGIQDTAVALREAERDGVRTFCVTVDRAGRDYLRRMCEPDRYMVIDEIEELPEALSKIYRAMTR